MTNIFVWSKASASLFVGCHRPIPRLRWPGGRRGKNTWSCGTGTYMSHLRLNVVILIRQGNTSWSHFVRLQSNVLHLAPRTISRWYFNRQERISNCSWPALPLRSEKKKNRQVDTQICKFIAVLTKKAGRSHSKKIDNNPSERVQQFKYLATTLTLQTPS